MDVTKDELNREVAAIWDANAAWWDAKTAEGDISHSTLIRPAVERLLELKPGDHLLEIACGNGSFARRLARQGAQIVATDFSTKFIELAQAHTNEAGLSDRIEYRHVDATDAAALLALGEGRFDKAIANMALMDMSEIEPLMRAITRLLKPGGHFVFSVTHPCFNHTGSGRFVDETTNAEGRLSRTLGVKVTRYNSYADGMPLKGTGIPGQPEAQYYFERTLTGLFSAGFKAGLVLDGLEEPAFTADPTQANALSWLNMPEIPPFFVARMRVLA